MIKGVEHIGLYAKDTKKLTDWYVENFDAKIVFSNDAGVYFIAFPDKSMIEICKNEEKANSLTEMNEPGLRHIAILTDDFEAAVETVKKSGAKLLDEPVTYPNGVSTLFFADIEGNILHLIARKNPLV